MGCELASCEECTLQPHNLPTILKACYRNDPSLTTTFRNPGSIHCRRAVHVVHERNICRTGAKGVRRSDDEMRLANCGEGSHMLSIETRARFSIHPLINTFLQFFFSLSSRPLHPPLRPPPHPIPIMGVLETILGPLATRINQTPTLYVVGFGIATFIAASILINVLSQIFLKNRNEPPIVFHWVPFIGSTISYGIDPYAFFFKCREKVSNPPCRQTRIIFRPQLTLVVRRRVHLRPARPKDHCLPWNQRQRIHPQRQDIGS